MATQYPVTDPDYAEHLQNYRSFVHGVMYAVGAIATVLILLAFFLL